MRIDFGFYVFFKLLSSVSFIFTTPVLLKSLGDEAFGVWSTISTFVTWLILIDFGVGNFLRNKVSELSAKGNIQEIHDSLEKSFHASIFLFFILVVFFGGASLLINWNILLSTKETNLALSVFAIVFFTSLSLVSNLIYFYLFGIQKNYVVAACQLSSQILFIFLVLLFGYLGSLTVFQTALIFGTSSVLPGFICTFRFSPHLLKIRSSNVFLNRAELPSFLSVGGKFFFIQITSLVLFSTDKVLMANMFGPEKVTSYEVILKVFSIALLIQSLILTPSWSKYSQDFFGGKKASIKNLLKINTAVMVVLFFLTSFTVVKIDLITNSWIGVTIDDKNLVYSMAFYVLIMLWNNLFAIFLNATNHIDLTFKICMVIVFVNIPLSYFLARSGLGPTGIVVGTIICLLPAAIVTPLQTLTIVRNIKDNAS